MLENPRFVQRTMADEIGLSHGETVNSFVKWLEELKYVKKTFETGRGKPRYEVPSRAALLNFYSRHRNMREERIGTFNIGRNYKSVRKFLSDNGAIMCLTTALQFYDDYFRDPAIDVYVDDLKLLNIIPKQSKGEVKVNLYEYRYADITKKIKGIRVTSSTRTIMDLFCNNMAHAAEQLIPKVWNI